MSIFKLLNRFKSQYKQHFHESKIPNQYTIQKKLNLKQYAHAVQNKQLYMNQNQEHTTPKPTLSTSAKTVSFRFLVFIAFELQRFPRNVDLV